MKRRIAMACMVGATAVVSACASEPTEPKTPASAEAEEPAQEDTSGLSDEEFWEQVEEKEEAEGGSDEGSEVEGPSEDEEELEEE
jgi:hypothetical protein